MFITGWDYSHIKIRGSSFIYYFIILHELLQLFRTIFLLLLFTTFICDNFLIVRTNFFNDEIYFLHRKW